MCLEDELLEPEEGALVVDALSDLSARHPHVLRLAAMTVRTEVVLHDELHHKHLHHHHMSRGKKWRRQRRRRPVGGWCR